MTLTLQPTQVATGSDEEGMLVFADGRLVGPRDLLGGVSFDRARAKALELADHMRRMGPFEPGRLPMEDMEYTTMPAVAERLAGDWQAIDEPGAYELVVVATDRATKRHAERRVAFLVE